MSCARCRHEEHLVDRLKLFTSGSAAIQTTLPSWTFPRASSTTSRLFRRDRQYFDYNCWAIQPSARPVDSYRSRRNADRFLRVAAGNGVAVFEQPVRRMTDTNLTLLPLSKVTFRVGYSPNVFGVRACRPRISGCRLLRLLLQEYQRNSTDDWTGSVEWKPVSRTRLTYEEQVTHTRAIPLSAWPPVFQPAGSDGYRVAVLQNYDNPINKPVGITCAHGAGI